MDDVARVFRRGLAQPALGVRSNPSATLPRLLAEIAVRPDSHVLPPRGHPRMSGLPEDLGHLYDLCGGLLLFADAPFPRRVCGPGALVPAGPRLLTPDLARQAAADNPDDLTNHCYVIVDGGEGLSTEPHVVMDLSPARSGQCYGATWDTYGLVGEMPLVARNVAELLGALMADAGRQALPAGPYRTDAYDL